MSKEGKRSRGFEKNHLLKNRRMEDHAVQQKLRSNCANNFAVYKDLIDERTEVVKARTSGNFRRTLDG